MDADLVVRAQHGDKGAYALIATEIASRFLAVGTPVWIDAYTFKGVTPALEQEIQAIIDSLQFE